MADDPKKTGPNESGKEPEGYWERVVMREPIEEWFPWGITFVIVAIFAVIIAWQVIGIPHKTEINQVGFRGTGMNTIYKASEQAETRKQIAAIPENDPPEPYEVTEDAVYAGEVYENVQVLGHLTEDNFLRLMTNITEWVAPEQGCEYCHSAEGGFAHDNLYTKVVARRMFQMTQNINANWSDHVAPSGVTCYTCHRGMNVPANIWFNQPEDDSSIAGWQNEQNVPSARVAYATLPNNIYEKYLMGDANIRVIPQEQRNDPTGMDTKDAEWTFGLMMHMSTALNVNCTYCHNTRAMSQWDQRPPAATTAWYGIRMVRELNNEYLAPLFPVYPDFRLGKMGDAPKANCATCHQGVYKPLYGEPMIDAWPSLAGPGPQAADAEQAAMTE
jgi:photosynthetic reaction center cytochrome c subunit